MPPPERVFGVWLDRAFVGALRQRGDHTRFAVHESYADNPARPVLGLVFEQDLSKVHASALRLPPWFSNLLPEGALRRWVADDRGVSEQREMELLAQLGRDLPGAVTVLPLPPDAVPTSREDVPEQPPVVATGEASDGRGRFSLAGVQLKLSMAAAGDRLVIPLGGALGDWIVKFPDAAFSHLPVVEFATMELARHTGIEVPETRLLTRDELPGTPDRLWDAREEHAFAIKRFDRGPGRQLIHIEDFAQVRDVWPDRKYEGSYETLAVLVHRGRDTASLQELVRRIAFNVLVDNSDAHLKNWSLRYGDPRRPVLSPAYDLVSVAPYPGYGGETALRIAGHRRPERVRFSTLERLGTRLGVMDGHLADIAAETVDRAVAAWPLVEERHLRRHEAVRAAMGGVIAQRTASLRGALVA